MARWFVMDWGAVVPNLITGIVGLAGIAGSIASARIARTSAADNLRTNITADDERQRRAEKRQIYAAYLGSVNTALAAISRMHGALNRNLMPPVLPKKMIGESIPYETARMEALQAFATVGSALAELELVAPDEVIDRAGALRLSVGKLWSTKSDAESATEELLNSYNTALADLMRAMRADLDRPVIIPK